VLTQTGTRGIIRKAAGGPIRLEGVESTVQARERLAVKVFISYSTAVDQIIALRLQTMAAVYGLTTYVPPATTRQSLTAEFTPEVLTQLNESDVVLAVITHKPVPSAVNEMDFALRLAKLLIPVVSANVPPENYQGFQHFVLNLADLAQTEREIVTFLTKKQQSETGKAALLGLATLALGLLLLGKQSD
jgi:hypothetical protein